MTKNLFFGLFATPILAAALTFVPTSTALAKMVHSTTVSLGEVPHYTIAKHLPYANPNAKQGGTLSMAANGTFNSLNPFIDKGVPATGTMYLYDTLMTGSLDEVAVMYPQLATGVTYDSDDNSWVIYHVNPKARFWDGTAVTAHDVKATFDAILSQGLMSWRSYLADVDRVEVLNSTDVKFIFKTADNKEIMMLVGQMPIFAKTSIETSFDKVSLTPLMGSGAYQVGKVDAGRSISYKKDPNYWGRDLMANVGRYNFAELKYVYYQSDEIAFEGFKSGQYRFRVENKARNWATAYNFPAAVSGQIKKESLVDSNPIPMQGMVMNLRRPLFDDIRTRQALNLAFDFEWMNPVLFYGQYERLHSFFGGSELMATGKPSIEELAVLNTLPLNDAYEKSALIATPIPYTSTGDGYNRHNLITARSLLLQAGFRYQAGKLINTDGTPVKIEILMGSDSLNRVLLPYVRNLTRLGIDARIRQVDRPQYLQRMREFDFDMTVDIFAQSSSPGAEQAYMWGSKAADEAGNQNSIGIKSAAVDRVIALLIAAEDREQTILYTKVLDRLLQSGYYLVPMYGKLGTNVAYWQEYRHPARLPKYAVGIDYWWAE
ncbi:MAG: extracellular solute-binding protein [Moraxella sp.]|nr:extracellular solute-binding protein [Moraxella sp.]